MPQRFTCQICQHEIARPGEECPYCKSRSQIAEGASPRILAIVFAVMVGCFALTTMLAGAFERERRDRGREHFESANSLTEEKNFDEAIEQYRDALLYSPARKRPTCWGWLTPCSQPSTSQRPSTPSCRTPRN